MESPNVCVAPKIYPMYTEGSDDENSVHSCYDRAGSDAKRRNGGRSLFVGNLEFYMEEAFFHGWIREVVKVVPSKVVLKSEQGWAKLTFADKATATRMRLRMRGKMCGQRRVKCEPWTGTPSADSELETPPGLNSGVRAPEESGDSEYLRATDSGSL